MAWAIAATMASAALAVWLRRGRYRQPRDEPRLNLHWWWATPVLTGVGAALLGATGTLATAPATSLLYLVGGVAIAIIDLDVHRIPNRILILWSAPTLAVLILEYTTNGTGSAALNRAVLGGAALALLYLLFAVVASMGLGDVKLAALTGAVLAAQSWRHIILGTMAAFAAAAIVAGSLLASGRGRRNDHLAFGPAIVIGAVMAINLGGVL